MNVMKVMKNTQDSNTPTYLRILNGCLSGRSRKIFPNQVVFYNTVFGVTNSVKMTDEYLEVMNRAGQGGGRNEDEIIIRQIHYFLHNGLDSNSANVGKHINNSRKMPIPKQHKAHFLNEGNRSDIVRRLRIGIQFCLSCCQREQWTDGDGFKHLLGQMKRKYPGG